MEANRTLLCRHRVNIDTDHNSKDLIQTTTAAKKSQNKGVNESYNGSARDNNPCTFPSQPTHNPYNKCTTGALLL